MLLFTGITFTIKLTNLGACVSGCLIVFGGGLIVSICYSMLVWFT